MICVRLMVSFHASFKENKVYIHIYQKIWRKLSLHTMYNVSFKTSTALTAENVMDLKCLLSDGFAHKFMQPLL